MMSRRAISSGIVLAALTVGSSAQPPSVKVANAAVLEVASIKESQQNVGGSIRIRLVGASS